MVRNSNIEGVVGIRRLSATFMKLFPGTLQQYRCKSSEVQNTMLIVDEKENEVE
jgi:hypothetical protein